MVHRAQQRHELAVKLRRARVNAELTNAQLAAATGLSESKISRIESGDAAPTPTETFAMATALKLQPAIRLSMVGLSESLAEPIPVGPRKRSSFPHSQVVEIARDAHRHRAFGGPYLFGFAQTPEYMVHVAQVDPGSRAARNMIAEKMRIFAEAYSPSNDAMAIIHESALTRALLPTALWIEQLRHLLQHLRHVTTAFAVIPDSDGSNDPAITVWDRSVALREHVDRDFEVSFDRAQAHVTERTMRRRSEDAVWDSDAEKLIRKALRQYEVTVDIREPQRYY